MKRAFPVRQALLVLLLLAAGPSSADKLTIERMFASPSLSGTSLRSAKISPDGTLVTYLLGKESAAGQLDLWAYDIGSGEHRMLVDSQRLAPAERELSAAEEARRERQRISAFRGIVEYYFSADSKRLLVPLGGDLYVYDLTTRPDDAVRRITETPNYETDARFSPDGSYVSFVRDQDLVVHDLRTGDELAITAGGEGVISYATAEFIAQEEMGRRTGYWWSPNDSRIAYTRVDESMVDEVERFEIHAEDVRVVSQRYPAAGKTNARVQLFIVELDDPGSPVEVDLGGDPDVYLARVDWFPDGKTLAVQRQSRDQKTLTLLTADAATGATRTLLEERAPAWVELHNELRFLERSRQFIWASSRGGYRHLYLYDNDGRPVRQLTAGDWSVVGTFTRALKGVDETSGDVYFMANLDTPLERHLYSVSLTGSEPRRLTAPGGWHSITMSKDARVYLDSFSTPERPPSVTLRAVDGKSLGVMVANELNDQHPYAPYLAEHLPTEFGTLEAGDGQTLYYQLIKPRKLMPGRRYPVIVDVYGGPRSQKVRRAWGSSARSNAGFFQQYLAQHGYVVFTLDNRGTGYRGVEFETALYKNMGGVEVEDQVTGVEFLRTLPFVDPRRIGVFGWSYGGYMALMSIMQAPDMFTAAVAGAPVTDWRLYDTHYTERYLGKPQDDPDAYAASNVLNHAEGLRGELLIIHGMADDNVLFTHSTALFKRLQDLGKPFQVMPYPSSKHGLLRFPKTGPHAYAAVREFFDQALAEEPEWEHRRLDRQADDLRIELAAAGVLDYEKTSYTSTDGMKIPAHLFRPPNPGPGEAPAVIYSHGSEHGRFRSRSMQRVVEMVRRGYVVLAPDYRSSVGYSRELYEAADYGGLEIDDMLAAREFLAQMPQVDDGRIAIMGMSHGGYNAVMALARAPGQFAAAVDFFGPTDIVWRVESTPDENPNARHDDREKFARMIGKNFDEAPELYRARSPRYLAEQISDPLLILHGDEDTVVLLQESEWLAEALEEAGNEDFAFHVIEGGKHGYPAPAMDQGWGLAFDFLEKAFADDAR